MRALVLYGRASHFQFFFSHFFSIRLRACAFVRPHDNTALEGKRGSCAVNNGAWFPEGPYYGLQPRQTEAKLAANYVAAEAMSKGSPRVEQLDSSSELSGK